MILIWQTDCYRRWGQAVKKAHYCGSLDNSMYLLQGNSPYAVLLGGLFFSLRRSFQAETLGTLRKTHFFFLKCPCLKDSGASFLLVAWVFKTFSRSLKTAIPLTQLNESKCNLRWSRILGLSLDIVAQKLFFPCNWQYSDNDNFC